MKKLWHWLAWGITGGLVLTTASAFIFWEQTLYLWQATQGQLSLFGGRSISEMLDDPSIDIKLKNQLKLVQEVKQFGETQLGLKPTRNYSRYVDVGRDYLVMVVSASPPLKLENYTWWFPIVGTVPYKGYFNKAKAQEEEMALKTQGYDTNLRPSPAYSTLGWFPDPLLSTMLSYGEYYLVNTIIHESTHATLFIPGHIPFNENLASFVGNKGALAYLAKKYGAGSVPYLDAAHALKDQATFAQFINRVYQRLEQVYRSDAFESGKYEKKAYVISQMKKEYRSKIATSMHSKGYRQFDRIPWNNALILSYKHYYKDQDKFAQIYLKNDKNIAKMLEYIRVNQKDVLQSMSRD